MASSSVQLSNIINKYVHLRSIIPNNHNGY